MPHLPDQRPIDLEERDVKSCKQGVTAEKPIFQVKLDNRNSAAFKKIASLTRTMR